MPGGRDGVPLLPRPVTGTNTRLERFPGFGAEVAAHLQRVALAKREQEAKHSSHSLYLINLLGFWQEYRSTFGHTRKRRLELLPTPPPRSLSPMISNTKGLAGLFAQSKNIQRLNSQREQVKAKRQQEREPLAQPPAQQQPATRRLPGDDDDGFSDDDEYGSDLGSLLGDSDEDDDGPAANGGRGAGKGHTSSTEHTAGGGGPSDSRASSYSSASGRDPNSQGRSRLLLARGAGAEAGVAMRLMQGGPTAPGKGEARKPVPRQVPQDIRAILKVTDSRLRPTATSTVANMERHTRAIAKRTQREHDELKQELKRKEAEAKLLTDELAGFVDEGVALGFHHVLDDQDRLQNVSTVSRRKIFLGGTTVSRIEAEIETKRLEAERIRKLMFVLGRLRRCLHVCMCACVHVCMFDAMTRKHGDGCAVVCTACGLDGACRHAYW